MFVYFLFLVIFVIVGIVFSVNELVFFVNFFGYLIYQVGDL